MHHTNEEKKVKNVLLEFRKSKLKSCQNRAQLKLFFLIWFVLKIFSFCQPKSLKGPFTPKNKQCNLYILPNKLGIHKIQNGEE